MSTSKELPSELHRQVRESARRLRKTQTESEATLWDALRNRGLEGRKFRRQHPIGSLIVDFYCAEERLVVEVDGPIHKTLRVADRERQTLLESSELRVLRLTNEEVDERLDQALARIRRAFDPHPRPLSPCGRGVAEGCG